MTYEQILESKKDFLTPEEVAPVVGCKPHAINVQVKTDASALGFPVCLMGTRVRIPRLGFIHWMKYGNAPIVTDYMKCKEDCCESI